MIIRELVTKLGFTFDKTNLDKFERSIVDFKTKTTIAVGTIGIAFKKVIDYATDFSDKVLKNSALAKFSKNSATELQALENVFQKFDVDSNTFQGFFEKLSIGIKEASRGVNNEFRTLVTQSQGAVRLFVNGQLTTTKQAIDDIRSYIRKIADESEQLRIVQNIFQVDIGTAQSLVNLFNLTDKAFNSLVDQEKQSVTQLEDSIAAAQDFKKQVNQLNLEWQKLSNTIAKALVPVLGQTLGGFNAIIGDFRSKGSKETLGNIWESFADAFDFSKLFSETENKRIQNSNNSLSSITNNNNFEFTVGPGTTLQQANEITQSVKSVFDYLWDEKVREVINNNPQVE